MVLGPASHELWSTVPGVITPGIWMHRWLLLAYWRNFCADFPKNVHIWHSFHHCALPDAGSNVTTAPPDSITWGKGNKHIWVKQDVLHPSTSFILHFNFSPELTLPIYGVSWLIPTVKNNTPLPEESLSCVSGLPAEASWQSSVAWHQTKP